MTNLIKTTALATVLGAAAVTIAVAEVPLGDVIVETRTSGVEGDAAGFFYPNFTRDLETAIEARLPTTGMEGDALIEVEVIELFLDGNTLEPDSEEFNQVQITVMYSHPDNAFPSEIYPMVVGANEVDVVVPEGLQVVDATVPDFYRVVIAGTADRIVERMPEEIDITAVN